MSVTSEKHVPRPVRQSPHQIFSFDDADVVLVSCDSIEFKVHSIVLRQASSFFRNLLHSSLKPGSRLRLEMTETEAVLEFIFRLVYPFKTAPTITSLPDAIPILLAVQRLEIEAHAVTAALGSYIQSIPHPLRAWAVACRFKYPEARAAAVKAFVSSNQTFDDDIPEELRHVDGTVLMNLQRLKVTAAGMAKTVIGRDVMWSCPYCSSHKGKYMQSISSFNRLDPDIRSFAYMKSFVPNYGGTECTRGTVRHIQPGSPFSDLDVLLQNVVDCEVTGASLQLP